MGGEECTIKVRLDTPIRGYPVYVEVPEEHDVRIQREVCNAILSGLVEDEMRRRELGAQLLMHIDTKTFNGSTIVPMGATFDIEERVTRKRIARFKYIIREFDVLMELLAKHACAQIEKQDKWETIGDLEFQVDLVVQPKGTNKKTQDIKPEEDSDAV